MAKELTTAELARLSKKGVVKFSKEDTTIAQFGELIEKINEMLEASAARTQADMARSQVQLEVLATLQKTMSKRIVKPTKSDSLDLGPLQDLLVQIQAENAQRQAMSYQFDIKRDPNIGAMAAVVATPIPPTKH